MALRIAVDSPTTERPAQIELPSVLDITTDALLKVAHPVARDIYSSCDAADRDACRNKDDPQLAPINHLLELAQETRSVGGELSQTDALFVVLVDPVDSCKIVIAYSSPWSLDVPV